LINAVLRVYVFAKRASGAVVCICATSRIPLVPFRGRKTDQQILNLCRERRRAHAFCEDADACAAEGLLRDERGSNGAEKSGPRPNLTQVRQRPRPVRVVKPKDCGLREDIRRAKARRVQWVAFDFGRPALVGLDEQPHRSPADRHGCRIKQRFARDQLFGLTHIRNDLLFRLTRACRQAGKRHRRAHQLQKRTTRRVVGDFLDL
jgi:hypothetical protein